MSRPEAMVDKHQTARGGLLNEVGQLVCLLKRVELSPARPVLVIVLWGIQVIPHSLILGWNGTETGENNELFFLYYLTC